MPPFHSETDPPPDHGRPFNGANLVRLNNQIKDIYHTTTMQSHDITNWLIRTNDRVRRRHEPPVRLRREYECSEGNHLRRGSTLNASYGMAQTVGTEVQRDINQQNRIEEGLQSGQLYTGEAARLEKGEARVEKMESTALKDGALSSREAARIQRAQNQESAAIQNSKHNDVTGNPSSPSSQRMQADVQRNFNQQNRVERGVQSGQLTNKEVSNLEGGQFRVNRAEARAGSNAHVGPREQGRIQRLENRQSNIDFSRET